MSAAPKTRLRAHLARGLAALVVVASLATAGWQGYHAVLAQPVARVVFAGDLDRLPQADLDALTQAVLRADRPSLAGVRDAARLVPWVRDASVRRVYPDVIEITFTTHEAVARWDERHLVSREGVVFEAEDASALPRLRGPEGAATQMVAELPAIAQALAPVGAVSELRQTPRGGREALLQGGLTLELGRGEWKDRAARFVAAWPRLPEDARATRYADLRYANGFALRKAK
jgi:cell division protein FtsQ